MDQFIHEFIYLGYFGWLFIYLFILETLNLLNGY